MKPFKTILFWSVSLSLSQLYVAPNTTLLVGRNFTHGYTFGFQDNTSILYLDNCTLGIGSEFLAGNTVTFTTGTMIVNGTVNLEGVNGGKLQIGDGVSQANNFTVQILPGSKLIIGDGTTLINSNI